MGVVLMLPVVIRIAHIAKEYSLIRGVLLPINRSSLEARSNDTTYTSSFSRFFPLLSITVIVEWKKNLVLLNVFHD